MEKIPEQFGTEEGREYLAPFEREEGKRIEEINAIEQLRQVIGVSDDSGKEEKNINDIISAAEDYLSRGGINQAASESLSNLIEKAKEELNKRRIESAKNALKGIKEISRVHDPRKERRPKIFK